MILRGEEILTPLSIQQVKGSQFWHVFRVFERCLGLQVQRNHWSLKSRSFVHASELQSKVLHNFLGKGIISLDPILLFWPGLIACLLLFLWSLITSHFFSNSKHLGWHFFHHGHLCQGGIFSKFSGEILLKFTGRELEIGMHNIMFLPGKGWIKVLFSALLFPSSLPEVYNFLFWNALALKCNSKATEVHSCFKLNC